MTQAVDGPSRIESNEEPNQLRAFGLTAGKGYFAPLPFDDAPPPAVLRQSDARR